MTRSERIALVALIVAVAALVGGAVGVFYGLTTGAQVSQLKADKAQYRGQAGQLYSQGASAGITPVVTPAGVSPAKVIPGPTGARGPAGVDGAGPSTAQVRAGVRAVCTETPSLCEAPVRLSALVAAVQSYCGRSACAGPSGSPGPSGAAGASGAAGPAPTAQQIADALSANCGGSCVGAKGDTGPKGDPGPSGPSGPAGPDCPSGYTPTTVTPAAGPAYIQCQATGTGTGPTNGATP